MLNHRNFVICDEETSYAQHLLTALAEKKGFLLQLHMVSTWEQLLAFDKVYPIDILLVEETLIEKEESLSHIKVVVLLSKHRDFSSKYLPLQLYKYQSADELLEQVIEAASKEGVELFSIATKAGNQFIAVYSPIYRCGKSNFAWNLGREYTEYLSVLLLNLQIHQPVDVEEEDAKTLSDLLYYGRQEGNFGARISTIIRQRGKLDYVLPCPISIDLKAVLLKDWNVVFKRLQEETIYDRIVLDLGDCVQGVHEILEQCSRIYVPTLSDTIGKRKVDKWRKEMKLLGKEKVLEKVIEIDMSSISKEDIKGLAKEAEDDFP